ncbi:MAG TPA: YfcC family protein [Rubricoccaceae bacterium]|nr:YfcC family protein [Rubricoccaceae bacterium]
MAEPLVPAAPDPSPGAPPPAEPPIPPKSKAGFKAPDTALLIFSIIAFAVVLTWIVPPGAFDKREIEVEGVGTREVVVPGSYHRVELPYGSVWERLGHSVGMLFKAPILGFVDEDAAPIIAFVLLIGGAFAVLQKTGAVDAALRRLVRASQRSRSIEVLLIPLFVTLFSLGGAVFGMAEETIPFILIFVPLALALGYDSITGVAIPSVGSGVGFAAAFLNPFTVGVAQGIAGLPLFSGAGFRVGLWLATTALTTAFIMWHAHRVRKDPTKSPTYALDQRKRAEGMHLDVADEAFTGRQKAVLALFFLGIAALVFGVLVYKWYIVEIAALFVALGIAMGIVGGLGADQTAKGFMEGARDLAVTALIIALARGILIVMQDGQIIDTILYGAASVVGEGGPAVAAQAMFAFQTAINVFIVSGSGQAALTMPLMAPLADLVGVTRQTAVLAFQMGDGFTNMIIPTSAVLMGSLSLAGVPWSTWARWLLPLQVALFLLGLVACFIAVQIGYA